jgi:hypothetical protein
MIDECVKMSEALNRTTVARVSFVPIPAHKEWRVELVLNNGNTEVGAASVSKGQSLMSLHSFLTKSVRKEIDRLRMTLGEDVEESVDEGTVGVLSLY